MNLNPNQYLDGFPDPESRRAFDPPPPSAAQWKRLSDAIATRVLPAKPVRMLSRKWRAVTRGIGAGLAVGVVWALIVSGKVPQRPVVVVRQDPPAGQQPPLERDPLEHLADLPVATDEEVRIVTLRGDWDRGLVVSSHLLSGELPIATADEVVVSRAPAGMQATAETGGDPMLFTIKPRRTGE